MVDYIKSDSNSKLFIFSILYIVLDYSRIHQSLHLEAIRPMMLLTITMILLIINGGFRYYKKNKQFQLMCWFIVLLACYIPFARNNFYAFSMARSQFFFMPFIFSIIICVDCIERLKKIFFVFICLESYVAIYALLHSGVGPGNYFADENDLSLYINMWIPFCFYLFAIEKKMINKIIYASGMFFGLLSIILSFSRGGFVGLLAVAAALFMFSKKKLITFIIIAIMAFLAFVYAGDKYWKEMSTITNTEDSTADERLLSWGAAWRMFLDNPWGVGGGNFKVQFPRYQSKKHKRGMWGRVAHSLWFTLIPELGVIGIYIFFRLLYYNLKDIFFLRRLSSDKDDDIKFLSALGTSFIASLAGYFASATFISVLYYAHYWYLTGLIIISVNVANKILDIDDH